MANLVTKLNGAEVMQFNTKETAVAIRAALKAAFPGVKFSVRIHGYSMGSSTCVRWTDGPTSAEVNRVTGHFECKSFDGSDDSTHYHTVMENGQTVQYSGYVSTRRSVSPELRALAERKAALMGEENVYSVLATLRPNGCRVMMKQEVA